MLVACFFTDYFTFKTSFFFIWASHHVLEASFVRLMKGKMIKGSLP